MKVEIRNFCDCKSKKYNFKKGLTLIDGPSGMGKSTIFNAIYWCLFGKIKNVHPKGLKNIDPGFTAVAIKTKGCVVLRTKPPETLKVVIGEKEEYEGKEAQEIINRIFGSRDVWVTTSYERQGYRNPLLSYSASEKLEIIKEILFGTFSKDREPDDYVAKLDAKIAELNSDINEKRIQKETLMGVLAGKTYDPDLKDSSKYDVEELRKKINKLNDSISDSIRHEERLSQSKKAKEEIKEIQSQLDVMNIENMELDNLLTYLKIKNVKVVEAPKEEKVTDFEISDIKVKVKNKTKGFNICKKYSIDYSQEAIDAEIKKEMKLKTLGEEYQAYLRKKDAYKQDKMRLKILEHKLKKGDDTYECPSCKTDLVLKDDKLEIYNDKKLVKEYQSLMNRLSEEIEEMEEPTVYNPGKVKELHGIIVYDLDDSVLKDKTEQLERYKAYIAYKEYSKKLKESYRPEYERVETDDPEKLIRDFKVLVTRRGYLAKLLYSSDKQFESSDKLKTELTKSQDLLMEKIKFEENKKIKEEVDEISGRVDIINKKIPEITNELEETVKIKEVVLEGINKILESQMNTFNLMLNDILSDLYEDISVKVKMFKKIKSRKVYKPQFDLSITLNGKVYDTFHDMSYGEKDRVSMAMTIAMNKIMNSKIIILDECMSSMDEALRVKAIESIRKHLSDKIVLNVCHGMVSGYYDQVTILD